MSSPNLLSGEYWQLHRNTLILSSALLIVSISSTKNGLSIIGLQLDDIGHAGIIFLLLVAASYSFIAFSLEWQAECWPRVRPIMSTIDELRKSGEVAADRINESVNLLSEQMEFYRNYKRTLSEAFPEFKNDEVQEVLAEARRQLDSQMLSILRSRTDPDWVREKTAEHDLIARGADQMGTLTFSRWVEVGNMKGHDLSNQIAQFEQSVESVKRDVAVIARWQSKARLRVFMPLTADLMRNMVVAMIFPALLFVTAVFHGLGRMGMNITDYSILTFLKWLG